MGPLKQSLVENIHFKGVIAIFLGLQTLWPYSLAGWFYRFWVFFRASSLQNEVGEPPFFFYISDITNSSSFNGKISRKKSMLEKLGANVLKRKCPLKPSEDKKGWHMMKNQNSSYFIQR